MAGEPAAGTPGRSRARRNPAWEPESPRDGKPE